MEAQPEIATPDDQKKSIGWSRFILWPFVILFLYVLSLGPVLRMEVRGNIRGNKIWKIHWPIYWAYRSPVVHKPLGLYFHLWAAEQYDEKGNLGEFP